MTPCLRDADTGDILETEVVRIKRKSFLLKFNKKNGWYVDWKSLVDQLPLNGQNNWDMKVH